MKPYEPHFEKAEQFLRSAQLLLDNGDIDSAASRLYYTMFFVAEALLQTLGLSFSSHKAVIAAYGQHFAKTGELDPKFHHVLISAFSQRQIGDYRVQSGLGRAEVQALLIHVTDFVAAGRKWLENREERS